MPMTTLAAPLFFDLKIDPGERGMEGDDYNDWWYRRAFLAVPLQSMVGELMATFKEFPPRQKPASFTIQQASDSLSTPAGTGK
jgi:arylsulfatase